MALSDAESDGFGAFDFSEFTADDFAQIDTHIACHFTPNDGQGQGQETSHCPTPESPVLSDGDEVIGDVENTPAPANVEESFEFDASLDLAALTEEDFVAIDTSVNLCLDTKNDDLPVSNPPLELPIIVEDIAGGAVGEDTPASIPVVEEQPKMVMRVAKKPWADKSLLERYRPRNILSVSDLVGPAWCEVQFDYGLRQFRSRPIDKRPKSFKTSKGKEIKVEVKVAEKNDVHTKQGQAVHKELEREIRGEEIKIDVRSDEERWGLRLLNAIACYSILLSDGMTREMPVFGMVNGAVVTGIIDEISKLEIEGKQSAVESPKRRNPHPSPRKPTKRARRTPSPGHRDIEDYFIPSPRKPKAKTPADPLPPPPPPPSPPPRYTLHISDTKTRVTDTLPPQEDTYGPRLQVMLYRRLLAALTSTTEPFDFAALWDELGIDSQVEFSTLFLVQAGLLETNEGFPTTNLDGLVRSWRDLVTSARVCRDGGVGGVDENLELIYRLQPQGSKGKGGKTSPGTGLALWRAARERKERERVEAMERERERETRDLAIAIRNSLLDTVRCSTPTPDLGEGSSTSSGLQDKEKEVEVIGVDEDCEVDFELQDALYHSLLPPAGDIIDLDAAAGDPNPIGADLEPSVPGGDGVPVPPPPEEIDVHGYKIIGRKTFTYDATLLQTHLDSVFELWRGQRKPVGVPVELSRRCNTCEYRNGCEWREEKALEMEASLAKRKGSG